MVFLVVPSLPNSLGLCLLWQIFSNHMDTSVPIYSPPPLIYSPPPVYSPPPTPYTEDLGVKLQCTLPGNIAARWPAGLLWEVPKGMCMPASLQGHNSDHACLGDPSPTRLPPTGLDLRPCIQATSAGLLWSSFHQLYLMGHFMLPWSGDARRPGAPLVWERLEPIHLSSSSPQLAALGSLLGHRSPASQSVPKPGAGCS